MINFTKFGWIILANLAMSFSLTNSLAQTNPRVDSLLNCLHQCSTDTGKVNLMLDLSFEFMLINSPQAQIHVLNALKLSEKCHYKKGLARSHQTLAKLSFFNDNYNEAVHYFNIAIAEFEALDDKPAMADCFKKMGLTMAYQDKYDSAIINYQKALTIFLKLAHKKYIAECYNDIGVLYNYKGDHKKSIELQQKSLEICRQIGDNKAIAARLINIGAAYADQSNYNVAIKYYADALMLKTEMNDQRGISICLNNLGEVYNLKGDFGKAIEYYEKSLKIDTELNDQEGMAICLLNIGQIQAKQDNKENALVYYNQSLAIAKLTDNKRLAANVLNMIGELLSALGQYDESIAKFNQSIELSNAIGDKSEIAKSIFLSGNTYTAQKQYSKAISAFQQAYSLHKALDEQGEMANDLIKTGKAWFELLNIDKAIDLYLQGFHIGVEIGSKETQRTASELLSIAYFYKKDYLNAYQYHLIFKQVHDSIFTLESKKQIAEVETRFALEQSQQQIELQQTRLARQDAELKQQQVMQYSLLAIILIALVAGALFINGYLRLKRAKTTIDQQMVQIKEKNEELHQINEELQVTLETNTRQKEQIETKNKEITDSIKYARYIQRAILPQVEKIRKTIPDHFVLIKPKQIISGDFYWITEVNHLHILAVADCTGHGVPGAFMSMLGISLLNEIINKENITRPDLVLQQMRQDVIEALNQKGQIGELRDGMTVGICQIDFKSMKLLFAGANTPLYIIRNKNSKPIDGTITLQMDENILYEIKGDKMPVALSKKMDPYRNHEIDLLKDDLVYLFSDGFADQFGGPEKKRFQYRYFKELLLKYCHNPLNVQKTRLEEAFVEWQNDFDQMDDILVLGFRVK